VPLLTGRVGAFTSARDGSTPREARCCCASVAFGRACARVGGRPVRTTYLNDREKVNS